MSRPNWPKIVRKWRRRAFEIEKEVDLATHFIVITLSLLVGVFLFVLFNKYVLPNSLPLPKTSAINWFVLHKHSLTLDYLRFLFLITILQATMILLWLALVWKRKK